jgi:hypothetical protein
MVQGTGSIPVQGPMPHGVAGVTPMKMENQITPPAPETMEQKYPLLYKYRQHVPLAHYELTLLIDGITKIEEQWETMYERTFNEDEKLKQALFEGLLHRRELKDRIIRLQAELFK